MRDTWDQRPRLMKYLTNRSCCMVKQLVNAAAFLEMLRVLGSQICWQLDPPEQQESGKVALQVVDRSGCATNAAHCHRHRHRHRLLCPCDTSLSLSLSHRTDEQNPLSIPLNSSISVHLLFDTRHPVQWMKVWRASLSSIGAPRLSLPRWYVRESLLKTLSSVVGGWEGIKSQHTYNISTILLSVCTRPERERINL